MRVCILYASSGNENKSLRAIVSALSEGISTQGHDVEMFDMRLEGQKVVSYYDYIIVGTEAAGFWGGKIPSIVPSFLKQAGTVSGKRCMAFITKGGLRKQKTLGALMKTMEAEGMYLKTSDVVSKPDYARIIGKRLHIDANKK
ncbi:flavodoxin family protein [Parasphaerochaeta coccoides]|uniref:flavodoxin family protein n=1 Tax=Parasphaerochaeta coccoides TaxID=273376 RepID=UPI00059CB4D1|nr:hypothetical protein [Parasphaerochaeta coccoides]